MVDFPDDLLIDGALKVLEDGPLPAAGLADRLRDLGLVDFLLAEVEDGELVAAVTEMVLDSDAVWSTPGAVLALTESLLDGLVLTHRLTQAEHAAGAVALTPDLVVVDWDLDDPLALVGGGALEYRAGPSVPGHDLTTLAGPDGWLDHFAPGDLLAFTRRGDAIEVTAVEAVDDDGREVALLGAAADARLPAGDGEEAVPIVLDALVLDPEAFRRPLRPLGELLEAAGLERRGFSFGRANEEWKSVGERVQENGRVRRAQVWGFDACCEAAFERVVDGYTRWAADERSLDDNELGTVVASLAHGVVASAFADHLLDGAFADERLEAFASTVISRARTDRGPAYLLLALAAERRGAALEAEAHLRAALRADPEYGPAAAELAEYEIDRSAIGRAITLLRHPDVPPSSAGLDLLEALRTEAAVAYRGVGRNDPCPCGSGSKFKACCQRVATVPLSLRTSLLVYKLGQFANRRHRRPRIVGVASSACDSADDVSIESLVEMAADPFMTDIVLFEGGVAEEYHEERGSLLPADERELLERLIDEPRRLWEVVDVERGATLTLRDTRTGDRLVVLDRLASMDRRVGEYLLARVVPVDDQHRFFGVPLGVPLRLRERTIELVDAGPDADMLAEWFGEAMAPPRLENREGEPLVLCRTELETTASLSRVQAALDGILERDGEYVWRELSVLDGGETIVRGCVTYDEGRLSVDANSEARCDRLVELVMAAVPDAEIVEDWREAGADLLRRRDFDTGALPDESPEMQAVLDEYVRKKEIEWLDERIPALGGLTPREARDDPTRREDLVALFRQLEQDVMPASGRGFDARRLQELLGLAD